MLITNKKDEEDLKALLSEYGKQSYKARIPVHPEHRVLNEKKDIIGNIGYRIPELPQHFSPY